MKKNIKNILNNDNNINYTIKNNIIDYNSILKEGDLNIKKGDLYLHDLSCNGSGPFIVCLHL
jgi:hypothetical protein